ncbi:MAG: ATP-binding cassette domain-containing protein, partial [Hyphomicrobiales bacterium]
MAPIITIENLGVHYPGADNWTLKDVSLEVQPNEFVALVGGSGVGKSTLVRVIAGLLEQTAG